jgi:hypothetical protein
MANLAAVLSGVKDSQHGNLIAAFVNQIHDDIWRLNQLACALHRTKAPAAAGLFFANHANAASKASTASPWMMTFITPADATDRPVA